LIRDGLVTVDGFPVRNPRSLVAAGAAVAVRTGHEPLRGELKLRAALEAFRPAVAGRVAMDVGAAAGGFTRALLDAGARKVYAVDAGHGQLLGSLRQDHRVVTLERTNLGRLTRALVPEPIELVTIDVSYVSLAAALPQLVHLDHAPDADLIALVKPMYELGLDRLPDEGHAVEAVKRARTAAEGAGWRVLAVMESPIRGSRGALEFFLWGVRAARG
jgi:23S rRNA (cytidine1920-2'-O)/16S rRNA (cytidine1409-2'-O)-methyltransferase